MKLHKLYILSIIIVMLNILFFDSFSSAFIENISETKIEVSLEEQESDEKLIVNISKLPLKDQKAYAAYDFTLPILNQIYLNNIFKPPIFS